MSRTRMNHPTEATNLADILERVLDKGIVVAGDIRIHIADIELISIKIRLLISSVDKAKEMGINWWESDPYLSTKMKERDLDQQNRSLDERIKHLEARLEERGGNQDKF